MPFQKKFLYPDDLQFEVACLVYAAATELGIVQHDNLWRPSIAKFTREKITTVKALRTISNNKLMEQWRIPKLLILKMKKLYEDEGWVMAGQWQPTEARKNNALKQKINQLEVRNG